MNNLRLFSLAAVFVNLLQACSFSGGNQTNISSDTLSLVGTHHFLHGYTPYSVDSLVNVVIEIPAGTLEKWEVDKQSGKLQWSRENGKLRIVNYLAYPANYGMIPQTLSPMQLGGDGDPLDVFVLGAALKQGSIVRCKLIGVIKLLDRQEKDDKLIAVTENSPFGHLTDINQLNEQYPGISSILTIWLTNYKGSANVVIEDTNNAAEAKKILDEAIQAYKSGL